MGVLVRQAFPVTPFTETWTGTDGAAWASPWGDYLESNAACAATIQSNTGELLSNGVAYAATQTFITGQTFTDFEATFKMQPQTAANESYTDFVFRCGDTSALGSQGPRSSYAVEIDPFYDQIPVLRRNSTGANTLIGSEPTPAGIQDTTQRWYKVRVVGSSIKVRFWDVGGVEPGTWQIEITDTTYTSGAIGFCFFNGPEGTSRYTRIDDLTIAAA